jgi:hypothetical protein
MFDPRQANNVCVSGQLLLLDLIEHLEPYCEIIQSNTDGVLIRVDSLEIAKNIKDVCKEWEDRTFMKLEYDTYHKVIQKDVNNYMIIDKKGDYKSKGAYLKKLSKLDNDLPIVNKALVDYFTKNIPADETILNCDNLIEFQKICKVSSKYEYAVHGTKALKEKISRVYASINDNDPGIFKMKNKKGDLVREKIAYTPEHCFIENRGTTKIIDRLDKQWYIDLTEKRIKSFEGE